MKKNIFSGFIMLFFLPIISLGSSFDYDIFDKLLQKYVSDGTVDYKTWKRNDTMVFEPFRAESLLD